MTEPDSDPELQRFLEACGSTRPLALDCEGPGVSGTISRAFAQPFVVIGRDPRADLHLNQSQVNRCHTYLQQLAGRLFCLDLQSRAGTHWEGRGRPSGWLRPGQALGIGPYRIQPHVGHLAPVPTEPEPLPPPPTSRSYQQTGLAEGALEYLDPAIEPREWRISRALVLVGRSSVCRVRLSDPGVSNFHCSLVRTPGEIWVVDLLSRAGTLVNGRAVRSARLNDGDELRLGLHRIRLRRETSPSAKSSSSLTLPGGPATAPLVATTLDLGRPTELGRPEVSDAVMMPLFHEFAQMQQQMADQFQQSLLMMFQMFSSMHREQMALIREELARIGQLTREQEALQADLARSATAGPRPPLRLVASEAMDVVGPALGPAAEAPDQALAEAAHASAKIDPGRPAPLEGQDPEEVHAALVRRLAAIQQERQGRWQKLLQTMLGKGLAEAPP